VHQLVPRLSPPAREAALVATVLGPRFFARDLSAMRVLAEPELRAAVDELLAVGVLVAVDGRLAFADAATRDAAREDIPGYAVAALERQGVDVRLAAGESPAVVAPVLAASAQPGDAAAIDVLVRAADALATADPAAAADLNRRTLELAPRDDPRRARLLADTALLLHAADRLEEGKAFAETALRGVLSVAQESEVLFGIAGMFALSGDTRADAGRRALELPGLEPEDRRRHLDRLIHNLLSAGRLRATRALLDAVGDEIRAGDDGHGYSMVMAETGLGYAWGRFSQVMARIESLARAGASSGEAGSAARVAEQWRCETLLVLDRYEEAAAVRAEALASAGSDGQSWAIRGWRQLHGRELRQRGDLADAVAVLEATFSQDGAPALPGANDAAALGALAGAALHLGDRRLLALCADWAEGALVRGTPEDRRQAAWILAGQALATGAPERARTVLTSLELADEPLLPCFPSDVTDLPQLVRIGLAAGDRALAATGVATAVELERENPGVASIAGAAAHARGLLERDADALEEAVTHFAATPRRPALASALEDAGALAAGDGERERAVARLDRALALYEDTGATWDATRVRRRLRRLGVRRGRPLARRSAGGWAALTPAEVAVMRLVAQGMTNREVAEHLFLSPHTVSSQLRRVFAELGVSSRTELAVVVAAHDADR
jgi:DNA-binding CsgD family transcriptional regulator/tetratricopeptide (TPR) repeat protein